MSFLSEPTLMATHTNRVRYTSGTTLHYINFKLQSVLALLVLLLLLLLLLMLFAFSLGRILSYNSRSY